MQAKRWLIGGIRVAYPCRVPWRDALLRAWQCVYWFYRRWRLDGVWQAILTALQGRATWPFASSQTPRVTALTAIQGTAAWIS